MSKSLDRPIIKLLCGHAAFGIGEAAWLNGAVAILGKEASANRVSATVQDDQTHTVTIDQTRPGQLLARCTCGRSGPPGRYCAHVAATLLELMQATEAGQSASRRFPSLLHPENQPPREEEEEEELPDGFLVQREPAGAAPSHQLKAAGQLLRLFASPQPPAAAIRSFDVRKTLTLEMTLRFHSFAYTKLMPSIELRLGAERLYVVSKIRDLLQAVKLGSSLPFTKLFTYDPAHHGFTEVDHSIIQVLIQAFESEKQMLETLSYGSSLYASGARERQLLVSPIFWERLAPLLQQANVIIEARGETYRGLRIADETSAPIDFVFSEHKEGSYKLEIAGLGEALILEAYSLAVIGGQFIALRSDTAHQLAELQRMIKSGANAPIHILPEQMEPFMDKVVPGLMKLGRVKLDESIAERMLKAPLQARLYLDRVRDRLFAGLEFQYGDMIINPLIADKRSRKSDRILIRDGEHERQIMALMEESKFARTEEGFFMEDEESEFEFLYELVPRLERLLTIHATTAVKTRIVAKHAPPSIRVNIDERTDWLEFKFSMEGVADAEIRKLVEALAIKRKFYRLASGALMPLNTTEFQEIVRFLNESGIPLSAVEGPEFRLPASRAATLGEADRQRTTIQLGKSLRKLQDNLRNPDHLDFPVPETLAPVLRDYQQYGYQWMRTLAAYRFGGILADDMGLGKTLQAIAFLQSMLTEIRNEGMPALIVAPSSLLYNWLNELKRFAPEMKAVIADGSKMQRMDALRKSSADIVIVSYPLLRRDIASYVKLSFHTMILDEAQAIKNHATQTSKSVKALQARYRFALTGTPIENSLEELWSIYGAVFPELLPARSLFNLLTRESVARRIRPFLLRRLKRDVLQELPEKIESVHAADLLPEQKKLYVAMLARLQQETVKHLADNEFEKHRIKILAGITRLRQLCCHPALFIEDYEGSSAKFEQLMEMLEDCRAAGRRPLIFSQFTDMLGMIRRELVRRDISYFYLDGQTPAAERVALCSQFNEGKSELFLLSLKAGGTGLNLTGADTVILYDLWWNPAVEQQAADRVHRIGQKNVVQIIRLVAQGTVEDNMYALQERKKNLIDEVIQPGQDSLSSLTEQDIREILALPF